MIFVGFHLHRLRNHCILSSFSSLPFSIPDAVTDPKKSSASMSTAGKKARLRLDAQRLRLDAQRLQFYPILIMLTARLCQEVEFAEMFRQCTAETCKGALAACRSCLTFQSGCSFKLRKTAELKETEKCRAISNSATCSSSTLQIWLIPVLA